MAKLLILFLFFSFTQLIHAQEITGNWYGQLPDREHLLLDVRKASDGYSALLDIPEKNIFRTRFDSIAFQDGQVFLKHSGLDYEFIGSINGTTIKGEIIESDTQSPLTWHREPLARRTQIVEHPFPYYAKDVSFLSAEEHIELAGTLTMPDEQGKFPAVVLITGSGAQNRDEEIMGHKPFLVLADHLTRNGIAVLRYDDRGTGESKGKFRPATAENYARDTQGAVQFLQNHPNILAEQIGLAGHSEGGNIAPLVATWEDIGFLVLLAAPGVSNLDMDLKQLEMIFENEAPEDYDRDFAHWERVYRSMAEIDDKETLKATLDTLFDSWMATVPDEEFVIEGGKEKFKREQIESHTSDWYHYFLQFDVNQYLPHMDMPILALNGNKDMQIEAGQNLDGFRKTLESLGHPNYKLVELENVNHFFQPCEVGTFPEVYFLEETFSVVALEEISGWIKENVMGEESENKLKNAARK
ncbi:alpha/beta fold hydrolase [Litoribacter populi]|uniref:alpha/beta fold hydrolase n=1 Tax=Litoribacter populi TaxID=2598460 RepID=UPI001180CCE3|nr:alpha/beta fold hydrolase [Litoribacter populi]